MNHAQPHSGIHRQTLRWWGLPQIVHDFSLPGLTGLTLSSLCLLAHNHSEPRRDPSFENNRRENRCLPERPVLPRWEKRLRRTGSVSAPRQSQGQIEDCAVLMKVPRSWLNGLETIVHKRHLYKCETLLTTLFKFILKQRVVTEELDCFPTTVSTPHKHHVNLSALILGAPRGAAVSSLPLLCPGPPRPPLQNTQKHPYLEISPWFSTMELEE